MKEPFVGAYRTEQPDGIHPHDLASHLLSSPPIPLSIKMESRGSFIVIEGLDRSGKSTQAERLRARIAETNGPDKVKLLKFPGTFLSYHVHLGS